VEFACLQLNPSPTMDKEANKKAQSSIISFTSVSQKRPSEVDLDKRDTRRRTDEEIDTQNTEAHTDQPTEKTTTLTNANNVPLFKTLRKIGNKLENVNHHYDLILEMQKKHIVPKGLKARVNPSVADLPLDLYTKWEETHIAFTQSLTDIPPEHGSRKKEALTHDSTAAHSPMEPNADNDEPKHITIPITQCKEPKKTHLTQRRERKTEDKTNLKKKMRRNQRHRRHPADNPGRYIDNPTLTTTNPWTQRPLIAGKALKPMKKYIPVNQRYLPKTRLMIKTARCIKNFKQGMKLT